MHWASDFTLGIFEKLFGSSQMRDPNLRHPVDDQEHP